MSRSLPVKTISGVAAGRTAIVDLPPGDMTYRDVILTMGATAGTFDVTDVNGVRITLDGDMLQRYLSGADYKALQDFFGEYSGPTSQLILSFDRMHMRLAPWATFFGQGVRGLTSFQAEIDIDSGAASGGSPTLAALRRTYSRATPDNPGANAPGNVLRVVPYQKNVGASGDHDFVGLLKAGTLLGVHVKGASGNVTGLLLELNDRERYKVSSVAEMESIVERTPGRTKQTNWFHADFLEMDNLDDQLVVRNANDFRVQVTTSGSDSLTLYAMYLESFAPNGVTG